MKRTQQGLQEQDRVQALRFQAYVGSAPGQGGVGRGSAPFLSQMRTVEPLMMTEAQQLRAQRAPSLRDTGGCSLPPGSLCHLLSSMRQFNLELSQGEGGRDVRGHLNSP